MSAHKTCRLTLLSHCNACTYLILLVVMLCAHVIEVGRQRLALLRGAEPRQEVEAGLHLE